MHLFKSSTSHTGKKNSQLEKGKVLRIRTGFNPNSSSLGIDMTLMLFGSLLISLVVSVVSAIVRIKARVEKPVVHGKTGGESLDGA